MSLQWIVKRGVGFVSEVLTEVWIVSAVCWCERVSRHEGTDTRQGNRGVSRSAIRISIERMLFLIGTLTRGNACIVWTWD